MTVQNYSQLDVLEKALRQQPLSVGERRVAAYLAQQARAAKNETLSRAAFGD
jgi:hypothetical protein